MVSLGLPQDYETSACSRSIPRRRLADGEGAAASSACKRPIRWIIPLCLIWLSILYVSLKSSDLSYSQGRLLSLATSAVDSVYRTSTTDLLGMSSSPPQKHFMAAATPHPDTISCDTVQQNVNTGLWPDPNQGTYYIRRVVDPPHFFTSVHSREYDSLRYTHIHMQGRYYEAKVIERFHRILNDTDSKESIVLDVGGNIGFYTLLSASHGHVVHTFEINPANLIRMCESLSLNRWADNGRAYIYQRAVSDKADQQLQVMIPRNPGAAHLQPLASDTAATNETTIRSAVATTITLDGLARDQGWLADAAASMVSIPLLKMDVEGAEPLVIEGAKELLASGIVRNVLTEFRRPNQPESQQALATLLESGYRIVDDDRKDNVRRLDLDETRAYLKVVEDRLTQRKVVYADLWFQLDENSSTESSATA